jgi:hypothetical protein
VLARGALDTTFGNGGLALIDIDNGSDAAYEGVQLSDGTYAVVGDTRGTAKDGVIFRLSANGAPLTSFGNNGEQRFDVAGELDRFYAVTLDSYGRIIASGRSGNGTDYDNLLVRWWP